MLSLDLLKVRFSDFGNLAVSKDQYIVVLDAHNARNSTSAGI